ncbi:MAG: 6-pyruvoyl-tetrahydropterin synthase-related protein, partial [Chloroflexota bacterium]|nr:6-pyruvoyl-tetrahydropterin synthase-related protein [Chloroflexota bacterium]
MVRFHRLRTADWNVLVCVLCALLLFQPLLREGLPETADGLVHLYRAGLWRWTWNEGIFWPRWHTLLYQGYGYPLPNFTPPVLYLLSSAFSFGTEHILPAFKGALFVACLSYLLGMYVWARDILGRAAALVAAVAYGFATYRFRELYFQGNYAQFLAWSLFPWVLFFFYRLSVRPSRRYLLGAFFSYALLLLTHNISAMLFSPLLGVYVLWHTWRNRRSRGRFYPLAALVAALGVGAIFLLPALAEKQYTQVQVLTEGYFDVAEHFVMPAELLASIALLDSRAANPPLPFTFGRLHLTLALIGALACACRSLPRTTRAHLLLAFLSVLGLSWLMTPASLPVWRTVPGMAFAEFPTRLFGPALLFSSFLVGAALLWIRRWHRLTWLAVPVVAIALILAVAPYQFPRPFIHLEVTPGSFVRYEREFSQIGTTSASEFLSIWTKERPSRPAVTPELTRNALARQSAGVKAEVVESTAHSLTLQTRVATSTTVTLAQFYFPGWRAWLDGAPISIEPAANTGLIRLTLPPGSHELHLRFTDTPLRRVAKGVTVAALIAVTLLVLQRGTWQPYRLRRSAVTVPARYAPLSLALIILAMFTLKVKGLGDHPSWFTLHSPAGQALPAEFQSQVGVTDEIELLGYDVDRMTVKQGEEVRLRLYWQAKHPPTNDYASFVHLRA